MEAQSEPHFSPVDSATACAECEQPTASGAALRSLKGASLCAGCVVAYYVACAGCGGLIPKDESRGVRGDGVSCADCFSKPSTEAGAGTVDETLIESLIAEYVALHAEEKRINDRMEVVKEQLKNAATTRRGEGNAVTLRADDAAIRCSYRTTLKCDAESAESLAQVLDEAEFSSLFERKTSFAPVKDRIAAFLSDTDETHRAARDAVRAAVRETETVTLSVVTTRK